MEAAKRIDLIAGVPKPAGCAWANVAEAGPQKDDRVMIETMCYVLRTGVALRDLPADFGPCQSVYTRWRQWCRAGLRARLFKQITDRRSRLRKNPIAGYNLCQIPEKVIPEMSTFSAA